MGFKEILSITSQMAPVASTITAIIAAIFISKQVINIRRNREVDTLFRIIALADAEKMRDAMHWLTYDLTRTLTFQELVSDRQVFSNFSRVIHLFETMGVIVNNDYVAESLIFDKYGLLIIGAWGKLGQQINALRDEWRTDEYGENFELLVSKYDEWARRSALKAGKGRRLTLRDGRFFLDHESRARKRNGDTDADSNQR